MARKGLLEGLPENPPGLEEPCPIFLLTEATEILRGPTTKFFNFAPSFMLHMDFEFFNVESIHGFTSTFVAIYSDNSYPFGFLYGIKFPPPEILGFLVTALENQDKTLAFI